MMNPFQILESATKSVPFVKYALGVTGIAAAAAIIQTFNIHSSRIPIVPIMVMLGLMIVLFVFSSLTRAKDQIVRTAAYTLVYTVVIVFCLSSILLFTAVFFKYPEGIQEKILGETSAITPEKIFERYPLECKFFKQGNNDYITVEPQDLIRRYIFNNDSFGDNLKIIFLINKYKQLGFDNFKFKFKNEFLGYLGDNQIGVDGWRQRDSKGFYTPVELTDTLIFRIDINKQ